MNWIFPIAGFGTRTSKLGEYKPLIEVFKNQSNAFNWLRSQHLAIS